MSAYDYDFTAIDGSALPMTAFKDKVVLVVNVASKCGLTPQYDGLEQLYRDYRDQGLVVLGVPCNQFGAQEPGTEEEILSFVRENYGEPFQLMAKVDVNGDDANPLYRMLREALPKADGNGDIAWNFTKFLVGGDGTPLKRYEPQVEPEEIQADLANFRS